jgi:UDP:flavonoid glycosyltransferase YjiC (YdhE family)
LPETDVAEWLQKEVLAPASDLVLHAAGLVTLTAAGLASGITNDKDNE